jgi:hypothetical protein
MSSGNLPVVPKISSSEKKLDSNSIQPLGTLRNQLEKLPAEIRPTAKVMTVTPFIDGSTPTKTMNSHKSSSLMSSGTVKIATGALPVNEKKVFGVEKPLNPSRFPGTLVSQERNKDAVSIENKNRSNGARLMCVGGYMQNLLKKRLHSEMEQDQQREPR